MKIQVNKIGWGNIWTFAPTSTKALAKLRRMYPKATWNHEVLCVEQRYEIDVALRLVREGFKLTRAEDDGEIEVKNGRFVMSQPASSPKEDVSHG